MSLTAPLIASVVVMIAALVFQMLRRRPEQRRSAIGRLVTVVGLLAALAVIAMCLLLVLNP